MGGQGIAGVRVVLMLLIGPGSVVSWELIAAVVVEMASKCPAAPDEVEGTEISGVLAVAGGVRTEVEMDFMQSVIVGLVVSVVVEGVEVVGGRAVETGTNWEVELVSGVSGEAVVVTAAVSVVLFESGGGDVVLATEETGSTEHVVVTETKVESSLAEVADVLVVTAEAAAAVVTAKIAASLSAVMVSAEAVVRFGTGKHDVADRFVDVVVGESWL